MCQRRAPLLLVLRDPVYHGIATQVAQLAGSQKSNGEARTQSGNTIRLQHMPTSKWSKIALYGGAEVLAAPKNILQDLDMAASRQVASAEFLDRWNCGAMRSPTDRSVVELPDFGGDLRRGVPYTSYSVPDTENKFACCGVPTITTETDLNRRLPLKR